MESCMACRICLNTDVKLYNMDQYRLINTYQDLCGNNGTLDYLLHHVCTYCAALLYKFSKFKEKCEQAKLLMEFLFQDNQLTTDRLRKINTLDANIALPYKVKINYNYDITDIKEEIDDEFTDSDITKLHDIKTDNTNSLTNEVENKEFFNIDLDFKNSSDDEPLSKKVKERKKKNKKKAKLAKIRSCSPKSEVIDSVTFENTLNWQNLETSLTNCDSNKINANNWEGNKEDSVNWEGNKEESVHWESNNIDATVWESSSIEDGNIADIIQNDESNIADTQNGKDVIQDYTEFDEVFLTIEQQIEEVLARKQSANYKHSQYKCEHCFKGFMTEVTYNNHMIVHDKSSGRHKCAVCLARWPDAAGLRKHAATHARRFTCALCSLTHKTRHKAKEHLRWHKGYRFVCKLCGGSFEKSTSYLSHVRMRHPSTAACEKCGDCFVSENGLRLHQKRAHRNIESSIEYSECEACGAKFRSEKALEKHRKLAFNETCDTKLRPCEHCGEGLASENLLKEHEKMHHKLNARRTCSECSRTFASERKLGEHARRAHGGAAAGRARGVSGLVCELCGYTCVSKSSLVAHQRVHTGEKPFECDLCHKKFSVQQRLQIHIRTHTGERPFKCSICPKAFKHKAALNRHERVHTGIRPYRCATCGKTFSQSNSMKQHASSVHLKAPLYARKLKRTDEPFYDSKQ